ncbi:MAG: alpha-ketoglutarate-dependent dioxygenase AlkB, partial [Acidimicrobiales bacterium]
TDLVAGPLIEQMRARLSERYGVAFRSVGLNLYRDGNDSVAWHGDRVARDRARATIAIVSLGEPRPFRLRPKGGGASIGYAAGNGDLLVMGGSCQRTWQHSVPKVHRAGPRISVTFRHELLRGPYEPA